MKLRNATGKNVFLIIALARNATLNIPLKIVILVQGAENISEFIHSRDNGLP